MDIISSNPRMILWKRKLVRMTLLLCGVLIVTILVCLIIASSWGPVWHLFNRDLITFQEWLIPVPKRFYFRQEGEVSVMWKFGFGVPIWDAPSGQIRLFSSGAGRRFQFDSHYDRFVSQSSANTADRGFRLLSEKRVVVDNRPGYCLQFISESRNSQLEIRCAIDNSSVSVWYAGDSRFVDDFWGVLQRMSMVREHP
jgi:hypothetical protein